MQSTLLKKFAFAAHSYRLWMGTSHWIELHLFYLCRPQVGLSLFKRRQPLGVQYILFILNLPAFSLFESQYGSIISFSSDHSPSWVMLKNHYIHIEGSHGKSRCGEEVSTARIAIAAPYIVGTNPSETEGFQEAKSIRILLTKFRAVISRSS